MQAETPPPATRDLIQQQIALLALAEGFLPAGILFALVKLGVFERLGAAARTADALAADVGADAAALARLLRGGVVLKLLETDDGATFRLAPAWRPLLADPGSAGDLRSWLRFLDHWYGAMAHLDTAVRAGHGGADVYAEQPEDVRAFTVAMHHYAMLRGNDLPHVLDTAPCRTLLDVGCGPGTYAFLLGRQNPDLELYLLDRPDVLAVAREVQGGFALRNRVHYLPCDLAGEDVPGTYDLVLVSNTLHALGAGAAGALVRRLYDAVNPGGSLVVQAQFLNDERTGPRWPVFLDLALLAILPEGQNHSVAETQAWLEAAGFTGVTHIPMSLLNTNSLVRGYRA
jgi:SAM-dependent methyltransferase